MVYTEYNEQFLDKRGTDHLIDELKAYIDGIAAGDIDLSNYVTKTELQTILNDLNIDIDLSSYATKEELTQAINGIDLSAYALKSEIPSLNGYATEQYVDDKVANLPSGSTDLSNYYTKSETYSKTEVDNLIPTVTDGKDGKDGKDGYTPVKGVDYFDGEDGEDGQDGYSPTVTVTKSGKVATITCTDKNGTTTATISDGEDGQDGSSSGGGSSSGSGGENNYSTEETAIGTWIDGRTIYRKVISLDLPSVGTSNYGKKTLVPLPSNMEILDWRAISYTGNSSTEKNTIHYIVHGDGLICSVTFSTSSVSNLTKSMDNKRISIYTSGTIPNTEIICAYGSSWAEKRCDIVLEYVHATD